ncbi:hypothetical protein [Mesorhizobium sp. M0520]|uniref:hypothetical protein n=1 Tax=Mesorhizobium sp. M0520 TaxID=2956957 RepID=UPI00333DDE35
MKKAKSHILGQQRADITLWRITNAILPVVLQLVPACAKISLHRPVIRWMPDYLNLGGAKCSASPLPF